MLPEIFQKLPSDLGESPLPSGTQTAPLKIKWPESREEETLVVLQKLCRLRPVWGASVISTTLYIGSTHQVPNSLGDY
jgi:hypothetical protein